MTVSGIAMEVTKPQGSRDGIPMTSTDLQISRLSYCSGYVNMNGCVNRSGMT